MIIFRQEFKENRSPNFKKLKSTSLKKFDEIVKISLVSLAEAPDLVFMLLNGKSHLHFHCVYDLVK